MATDNQNDELQVGELEDVEEIAAPSKKPVAPAPPPPPGGAPVEKAHKEHARHGWPLCGWYFKMTVLLCIWTFFTVNLFFAPEQLPDGRLVTVPANAVSSLRFILLEGDQKRLGVGLRGAFAGVSSGHQRPEDKYWLYVYFEIAFGDPTEELQHFNVSPVKRLQLVPPDELHKTHPIQSGLNFDIVRPDTPLPEHDWHLRMYTNTGRDVPVIMWYEFNPVDQQQGLIYGTIVLVLLYIAIVWDVMNRTVASLVAATLAIGILAAFQARPEMTTIMSWIDLETLMLLFGMMILVAILADSGIFDYLAVLAFEITHGAMWPLINCLCAFVGCLSAFLDNVTMMLLITPVTIRLCEVKSVNPVPIMLCMVFFSNIGAALTPVGDPPNVIITANKYVKSSGVNFGNFFLHMAPGVVLSTIAAYIYVRWYYRNPDSFQFKESHEVEKLRHEIHAWQRTAEGITPYSKDEETVRETLLNKIERLKMKLEEELARAGARPEINYEETLSRLKADYPIRNKVLLIKASIAFVFVLSLFVLHSVPHLHHLSLGWAAMIGALLLLVLADVRDMEAILVRVEWSTLIFFCALFILMEALSLLGVIGVIGDLVIRLVKMVSAEWRLSLAILIILWVSAVASAFLDNIPVATMMLKIIISLNDDEELDLPLHPLVWSLAFGACLGGNGTIIGASANVVSAGVIEQHGYKITFMDFFRVGFPVMIVTVIVTTGYLLFAHVLFQWH